MYSSGVPQRALCEPGAADDAPVGSSSALAGRFGPPSRPQMSAVGSSCYSVL